MSALKDHLEQLIGWIAPILGRPFPTDTQIGLFEIDPNVRLDKAGRLIVSRKSIQTPAQFEERFSLLVGSLPWINLSAYGFLEEILVVGVEHGVIGEPRTKPAAVNLSGPMRKVMDANLDVRAALAIDDE